MQTHRVICIALIAAAAIASKSACAQPYPSRPVHPDVPTLAESGLPGYEAGSWYGLAVPKGTPSEIIATLNAETRRIFADPAFRDTLLTPNFILSIASSPEVFAERIRSEWVKWGEVIRDAGLKPD